MNFDFGQMMSQLMAFYAKTDKRMLAGGAVAIVALLGGLTYWGLSGSDAVDLSDVADGTCVAKTEVPVSDEDYIIGDKKAPITLVEYLSQTCSHCAEFRREEVPKIEAAYVKTGLVRIVFRELHRNNVDVAASVLGRCLGRDAFLPFTDMLLEHQQVWMMREDRDIIAGLKEMARRAGMSSDDFDTCLKKQELATQLAKASAQDAKDYCISGTPTLLLNGKKLEGMATSYEKLDAAIKDELKKLGLPVPASATPAPAEGTATPATATEGAAVPAAVGETAPDDAPAQPGAPAADTPPAP